MTLKIVERLIDLVSCVKNSHLAVVFSPFDFAISISTNGKARRKKQQRKKHRRFQLRLAFVIFVFFFCFSVLCVRHRPHQNQRWHGQVQNYLCFESHSNTLFTPYNWHIRVPT